MTNALAKTVFVVDDDDDAVAPANDHSVSYLLGTSSLLRSCV